jgi:hypothetical protein
MRQRVANSNYHRAQLNRKAVEICGMISKPIEKIDVIIQIRGGI